MDTCDKIANSAGYSSVSTADRRKRAIYVSAVGLCVSVGG